MYAQAGIVAKTPECANRRRPTAEMVSARSLAKQLVDKLQLREWVTFA